MFKSIRRFVEMIKTCISFSADDMKFVYRLLKNKPKKADIDHLNFCIEFIANKSASYEQIKRLYYVENISPLFMEYFDLFLNIVGDENSGLSAGDMNFVFHALTHRDEKYYLAQDIIGCDKVGEHYPHYARKLLDFFKDSEKNSLNDKIYCLFKVIEDDSLLTFIQEYVANTNDSEKNAIAQTFANYYDKEEFHQNIEYIGSKLPNEEFRRYKRIVLNMLALSVINRNSLFDESEKLERIEFMNTVQRNFHKDAQYSYYDTIKFVSEFEPSIFVTELGIKRLDDTAKIKNMDILDCGACFGDSSIVLAKYTDKNVYAFEPVARTYDILVQNIAINKIHNIVPVDCAVGEFINSMEINVYDNKLECSSILDGGGNVTEETSHSIETINVTTIDSYVENNKLNVGLIKFDIEGYEQASLRGALNTLKIFKPTLLISIYHNAADFFEILPFIDSLNLGYNFKIEKTHKGNIIIDTMLICEVTE